MFTELKKHRNKCYGECCYCSNLLAKGEVGDRFEVTVFLCGDRRYDSAACRSLDNVQESQSYEQSDTDPFNGAKFPERVYD